MKKLLICFSLLLLPITASFAAAGCCSHHGGVVGCNNATGHAQCKDGSNSPTCACTGNVLPKTKKATQVQTQTQTTTAPSVQPKKSGVSTWFDGFKKGTKTSTTPAGKTTKTTPVTNTVKGKQQKGCCARHGGVAKCNKATGFQMCKDGTTSSTCRCQ